MKFPFFNLSQYRWVNESVIDFALFNAFIYTDDDDYFNNFLKNNKFCDCSGTVYVIKDKMSPTQLWRKIFRFIPSVYKVTLQFEKTDESIPFELFKVLFITKNDFIQHNDIVSKYWIDLVKKSESFEDLYNN